jgi:AraC family transcriptional regulator
VNRLGGECEGTQAIVRSAAIYDASLRHSGGHRVDVTSCIRSHELYVALYESPPFDLKIPAVDVPRLTINLADAAVTGGIASDRRREYAGRRYSLFFTPSGSDARWIKSTCSRHLNIYFRAGLIDDLAREQGAILCPDRPLLDLHMRRLKPWIDALELTINHPGPYAYDVCLGLAHLIVAELARTPHRRSKMLRPHALAKVCEYISAYLPEKIYVSDLAALADMSRGRFAQSFRESTGLTPHRYIVQERIEAVRRHLSERQYCLAEVAARCGFASQQHMATVMRRLTGVAPSEVGRSGCSDVRLQAAALSVPR